MAKNVGLNSFSNVNCGLGLGHCTQATITHYSLLIHSS
jgi:hypothetical protein